MSDPEQPTTEPPEGEPEVRYETWQWLPITKEWRLSARTRYLSRAQYVRDTSYVPARIYRVTETQTRERVE